MRLFVRFLKYQLTGYFLIRTMFVFSFFFYLVITYFPPPKVDSLVAFYVDVVFDPLENKIRS